MDDADLYSGGTVLCNCTFTLTYDSMVFADLYGAEYDEGADSNEVDKSLGASGTDSKDDGSKEIEAPADRASSLSGNTKAASPASPPPAPRPAEQPIGSYQTNTAYNTAPVTNPIASYQSRDEANPASTAYNYGLPNQTQPRPNLQGYGNSGGTVQQHASQQSAGSASNQNYGGGYGGQGNSDPNPSDGRDEG